LFENGRKAKFNFGCLGAANANLGVTFSQYFPGQAPNRKKSENSISQPGPENKNFRFTNHLPLLGLYKARLKVCFPKKGSLAIFSKIRDPLKYANLKFVKMFCVFEN